MPEPEANSFDPVEILSSRVSSAIARAFPGVEGALDPMVTASKQASLGDFQCNAAMALGKRAGVSPREAAARIVGALEVGDVCEPVGEGSIAGPGFINLRLRAEALGGLLSAFDGSGGAAGVSLGVRAPAASETVVVDLCGVNLAKEMHVGHLRATIIGDAVARMYARLGHRVIRQNHLGDWGLPIAMVTGKLMEEVEAGRVTLGGVTLADMGRLYKAAQRECDTRSPAVEAIVRWGMGPKAEAEWEDEFERVRENGERLAKAKRTLVKLQSHDPEVESVWRRIVDVTIAACVSVCARLNAEVLPEHTAGESSYADELGPLVEGLLSRGIAEVDEGAVIVRLDREEWGGIAEPCLIRKRDGGYLYATTDLAAIRRRVGQMGAGRVIYCVDARQSLHFRQVFAACERAGFTAVPGGGRAVLRHAAFGMVLGEDGKPFKTRSGENVRLADLIDEAEARAFAKVTELAGGLSESERREIAWATGVAAIKYTDLSSDRVKDYVFSFDRMVSFEGNTGPYLLYALVRTRSIARKASEAGVMPDLSGVAYSASEPAEKALALSILRYPGVLRGAAEACEPHRVCQYLYDLAGAFARFFDQCPVLKAPTEEVRASRLKLCDLAGRVLADGLETLGIPTVERM
ncbi:MAG: arginine--tRNA ligase [Phycisphaeraceae bacterium]|nr:MAG: arginine--tRNA ligase [Phycisphaeraceae bacterium]